MRITTTPIALLALPALIHASPVKLIDFVPRLNDISGDCDKVYQQVITGCEPSDFTQQGCSVSCVKGLASMTKPVKDACGDEGLLDGEDTDSNVLAQFLQDRGPKSLCTNADEVLQSNSGSSTAPTTSEEHSTKAEPTQHSTTSEQSSTTIVSSTATASLTNVPTSLVMDTSSSPEPTSSTSSAESTGTTASSTSAESSQIFEAPSMPASFPSTVASSAPTASSEHSGGGSPFDAEGNQFSAATATTSSAVMLVLAVAFAALAAQW